MTAQRRKKEVSKSVAARYPKQFNEAKRAEVQSWIDNDAYELIDMRRVHVPNFVTGRWVLTWKRDDHGNVIKAKARWVLRGFQDWQKEDVQTDSTTGSRPGLRLACALATINHWDIHAVDLRRST